MRPIVIATSPPIAPPRPAVTNPFVCATSASTDLPTPGISASLDGFTPSGPVNAPGTEASSVASDAATDAVAPSSTERLGRLAFVAALAASTLSGCASTGFPSIEGTLSAAVPESRWQTSSSSTFAPANPHETAPVSTRFRASTHAPGLRASAHTPGLRGTVSLSALANAGEAAIQRNVDLHEQSLAETGIGAFYGSQSDYAFESRAMRREDLAQAHVPGTPMPTPEKSDCISWTMRILGEAYRSVGREGRWEQIRTTVTAHGTRGTDLARELESDGWKGIYFNPDPRLSDDGNPEHGYTARRVAQGKPYYGLRVDDRVIGYRPTPGSSTTEDLSGVSHLEKVPFFVGVARGGDHVFVGRWGRVNEFHWDVGPTEAGAIEETPLPSFVWNSGILMVPPQAW